MNIFEILGPVMVGPSSSHTAGAVRIGYISRQLLGEPVKDATLGLYGSFWLTGSGHGTPLALIAGLCGMHPDDARIPRAFAVAKARGMRFRLEQAKETQVPESAVLDQMDQMAKAMEDSITQYDPAAVTTGKMGGQNGARLVEYNQKGDTLLGDYLSAVIAAAVQVAESNACMKRIVAAPTAGSCGVIPAVLITYQKQQGLSRQELLRALLVSAGIGSVIAENASISGAQGGCQAEIGSAAAMAAGGLVYLAGGDNDAIAQGAAMALKNMLGLACDPVAGLVETPCIKRNAAGAANAVVAAQMALAGIQSVIPPDEVIDAMYEIGCQLPACLRETSQAGLATTPTGQKIAERLGQNQF